MRTVKAEESNRRKQQALRTCNIDFQNQVVGPGRNVSRSVFRRLIRVRKLFWKSANSAIQVSRKNTLSPELAKVENIDAVANSPESVRGEEDGVGSDIPGQMAIL